MEYKGLSQISMERTILEKSLEDVQFALMRAQDRKDANAINLFEREWRAVTNRINQLNTPGDGA